MKKYLGLVFLLVFTLFITLAIKYKLDHKPVLSENSGIYINNTKFNLEIADTDQKKSQGLSGRLSLPENSGMLFVFSKPDYYYFWMKEMKFPLDFIFINGNKIVDLSENVPIPSNNNDLLTTFTSKSPADKILEVNAGTVQKIGTKISDTVIFK